MNKEMFYALASLFLIREKRAREDKRHDAAVAYANAYDWLCYAVEDNSDCLMMFDDMDEAVEFANQHKDSYIWELEDFFKNPIDK